MTKQTQSTWPYHLTDVFGPKCSPQLHLWWTISHTSITHPPTHPSTTHSKARDRSTNTRAWLLPRLQILHHTNTIICYKRSPQLIHERQRPWTSPTTSSAYRRGEARRGVGTTWITDESPHRSLVLDTITWHARDPRGEKHIMIKWCTGQCVVLPCTDWRRVVVVVVVGLTRIMER